MKWVSETNSCAVSKKWEVAKGWPKKKSAKLLNAGFILSVKTSRKKHNYVSGAKMPILIDLWDLYLCTAY